LTKAADFDAFPANLDEMVPQSGRRSVLSLAVSKASLLNIRMTTLPFYLDLLTPPRVMLDNSPAIGAGFNAHAFLLSASLKSRQRRAAGAQW